MLIRGMEKGLQGSRRETVPKALQQPLAKLWEQGTPDPTLIRFAIRLGSKKAREEALRQVVDNTTNVKTRLLLLQVLGQVGREEDASQLLTLLSDQTPAAVRGGALQALQRFQSPEIPRTVPPALFGHVSRIAKPSAGFVVQPCGLGREIVAGGRYR